MSNYTVGQAVVAIERLHFIVQDLKDINQLGYDCYDMDGLGTVIQEEWLRPATEEEILAECATHGWVINTDIEIEGKHINLYKNNRLGWRYSGGNAITTENLKELCEEGLQAHRIITALNLAK